MIPGVKTRGGANRSIWLITFTDLVALLLAFFVMMFATQSVKVTHWTSVIDSLSKRLNPGRTVVVERPRSLWTSDNRAERPAISLPYLEALLKTKSAAFPAFQSVLLRRYDDRLVIVLPADMVFEPGSAGARNGGRAVIEAVAGVLMRFSNGIEIEGHADPRPLERSVFRSNWELSLARAVTVAAEMRRAGYTRTIPTFGLSAGRFGELADIENTERRLQMARRVDIVVRPTAGSEP